MFWFYADQVAMFFGYLVMSVGLFVIALGLLFVLGLIALRLHRIIRNKFLRWCLGKRNPKHLRRLGFNYVVWRAFKIHSANMTRKQILRKLWYLREVWVFKTRNDPKSTSRALSGH